MARSTKKGPYIDNNLLKKVAKMVDGDKKSPIKTWARYSQIPPEFVGYTFQVHNGNKFIDVYVSEAMVGHRLGEFSPTKKFIKHGGRMQKELEQAKKEAEIAQAQAATAQTGAGIKAAPAAK